MPEVKLGIKVKATHVFWQDQGEYYFVCGECYLAFNHMQWSGSTKIVHWEGQKTRAYRQLQQGQLCEWCLNESWPV